MKTDDNGLFHYDGNGHLVIFHQCILCDFIIPLKNIFKDKYG